MSSIAPSIRSQTADARADMRSRLGAKVIAKRKAHRRNALQFQFVSYLFTTLILSLHASEGNTTWIIPLAYLVSGGLVTGSFQVLSITEFSDRFEDHYLTLWQMTVNIAVQLMFLIAVPQIGYMFIGVIFLIFSFGTLRMTTRQATIAWTLTTIGILPICILSDIPTTIPAVTSVERLAVMLAISATIGQCAIIGLYGSGIRRQLYQSSKALRTAYRRIEELAEIDELTGAFNRRSIMRKLDDEIMRAQRLQQPFSVALIDLDWFKKINDAFGHPAGDEVLRTFAITVFANIREIDFFGRYGGEEFLLLLPGTPRQDAEHMLDRLRIIIADLDWSALSPGAGVSISAGVATLIANETPDSLLMRADTALYTAKRSGRNRIAGAA